MWCYLWKIPTHMKQYYISFMDTITCMKIKIFMERRPTWMDIAGERLNHGSSWIMPNWVRFLPKWLLGKVKGVGLGSLVIHLFENYYIKGLLLICLAISRSLSEKLGSNYDCFTCITLFRETKFSNASNLKLF